MRLLKELVDVSFYVLNASRPACSSVKVVEIFMDKVNKNR